MNIGCPPTSSIINLCTALCASALPISQYMVVFSFVVSQAPFPMVNVRKFQLLLFPFSNEMLVFMAGINKIVVRIADREDPDQTASSEAV